MWLTQVELKQRNAPLQIQKIYVFNVDPPPKLCEIDKKYRDPSVSICTLKREIQFVAIHVAPWLNYFAPLFNYPPHCAYIYNPLIGD